ncbi:MAG TPA: sugar ABC transporter substrate-binding protein [Pilimelia sp.]|nr:sugar ABC transporter substrate-binding protein [Pilimelia sp.]
MHSGTRRAARLLAAGLAAALATGLAACSDDGKRAADDGTPPKVGFVNANSELRFAVEMAEGFESGVAKVGGVEQEVVAPPIVDGPAQLQMFQEMKQETTDGISVFTLSPELFAAPLAEAASNGIPLIAVDNPPPPSSNVKLFIGNDNYEMGQQLADAVISKLPANATGRVVMGTASPGVPVLDQRANGMRDRFKEKLPGVRVTGPFDTKQDIQATKVAWSALVKANPNALAFLGTGEGDGYTLGEIRRETGGKWLAGAFDLDPKSLQLVKEGHLVLMSPEHYVKGALAGQLQAQHAKNGDPLPEGWLYTPGLLVDQSNIDEIIKRQATIPEKDKWFAAQIEKILSDPSYLRPLSSVR